MLTWLRIMASFLGLTLSIFVLHCGGGGQVSSESGDSSDGDGVSTESETPASETTGRSIAEDVFGVQQTFMAEEAGASISSPPSLSVEDDHAQLVKDVTMTSDTGTCTEAGVPEVLGNAYLLSGSNGGTCNAVVDTEGGAFSVVVDCDSYDSGTGCVYSGVFGADGDPTSGVMSFGSSDLTAICDSTTYTVAINASAESDLDANLDNIDGCLGFDTTIFSVSGSLESGSTDDDSSDSDPPQVTSGGTCGNGSCETGENVGSCAADCTLTTDFSGTYLLTNSCIPDTRTDAYTGTSNGPYSSTTSTFAFTMSNSSLCEASVVLVEGGGNTICTSCTYTGTTTTVVTAVCGDAGCTTTLTEQ